MREIFQTSQFRKDFKKLKKMGKDIGKLKGRGQSNIGRPTLG